MDNQQEETARSSYNRMSKVYALMSDSSEKRFISEAIEDLLKPQPGEVVLEPGFGTGQALAALAELVGAEGRVYGIDISDGMVEQTRKRLEKHALLDRADISRGDATCMPYADSMFDAVFMSFTLELFSDDQIPVVLAEARRVLKPDGRLCVACMSSQGGQPTMEKLYEWSHRKWPTFVDCRPIDAAPSLADAGFTIEQTRKLSMWGLAVDILLARA
ncbi:MAG: methyltransferase domain-containing protein [Candidatus Nanopelagicales bacterium]|nr:methyltransferase domain-containing protein [Candidatus Nanopelagicales bacterium]MDZ7577127.1 methyltransferase domain-containing protein [Candidatus Nanopelagicales bacterium]